MLTTKHGLHLAQLYPEASDLHLLIRSPEKLDVACFKYSCKIPSAVNPASWLRASRIGQEPLGSEVGTAIVATRKAAPADMDFAHRADWAGIHLRVQYVNTRICDRPPQSYRPGRVRALRDSEPCAESSPLCWAISVDDRGALKMFRRACGVGRRQRLAADDELPHAL